MLRYEDLTGDPGAVLRPLFDFLDEVWEPDVVEYARFPHHAGFEDPDVRRRKRIEPNSGNYRAWPVATRVAVRDACGPLLQDLGYETDVSP
jgi:hypothetical protein